MLALLADAEPDAPPGAETKYHYLTFGWLCDGIVRGATKVAYTPLVRPGTVKKSCSYNLTVPSHRTCRVPQGRMSLRDVVHTHVAKTLDVDREMMIGLGSGGCKDPALTPRLSTLVLGALKSLKGDFVEGADKDKDDKPVSKADAPVVEEKEEAAETDELVGSNAAAPAAAASNKRRPPMAPSLLMNPTFFNNPRIREASIPAANGHFSARALAKFYAAIAQDAFVPANGARRSGGLPSVFSRPGWGEFLRPKAAAGPAAEVEGEVMFQGGSGSFGLGYTLFPATNSSGSSGGAEMSPEKVAAMAKRFNVSEDDVRAHFARRAGKAVASPSPSTPGTPGTPGEKDGSGRKGVSTLFHKAAQLFSKSPGNEGPAAAPPCVPSAAQLSAVVAAPQALRKSLIHAITGRASGTWVSFGHGGVGGSMALVAVRAEDGKTFSIAVTLNRLSFVPSKTSGRIVGHIYRQLGLPVPDNFA